MKCPNCKKEMKLIKETKIHKVYECECNKNIIYTKAKLEVK